MNLILTTSILLAAFSVSSSLAEKSLADWTTEAEDIFIKFYGKTSTYKASLELEKGIRFSHGLQGLSGVNDDGTTKFTLLQKDLKARSSAGIHNTHRGFYVVGNHRAAYPQLYTKPEDPGMSLLNLLYLPERPIYNGVTLTTKDIDMLNSMKTYTQECIADRKCLDEILHVQEKAFSKAIVERRKAGIDEKLLEEYEKRFKEDKEVILHGDKKRHIPRLDGSHVKLYLHLHPNHGIGQLVVHVVATHPAMRTNTLHDHKNFPIDAIIHAIKSPRVQEAREKALGDIGPLTRPSSPRLHR
ncbi:hypothetical protein BJ684DRAFT_14726 [Piptocephalis cylindrospora]|uniref:Uncharacterized protein n=1 Tax=Piptocephalis cylindrospora TaxID=1907219 RepID=A0A4P9YA94_9FUNG|nr:hypothetical protein BJ684DRAFT_14726 [Piptocephalis cylindrospora]|eukprot:RKP14980.1 hypothetical protein BJ684DRAFT_14726 [Piptocephalis cylindrospora]